MKKADYIAIALAIIVILILTFLPSPKDNNPPVPPDSKHKAVKLEKDCLACHVKGGESPLIAKHPKRQDCLRCHRLGV